MCTSNYTTQKQTEICMQELQDHLFIIRIKTRPRLRNSHSNNNVQKQPRSLHETMTITELQQETKPQQ